MLSRNQNILSLSRLSALLLLIVLVLLNVAATRTHVRIDMTEEGLFTLSDASGRVLSNLEDPATIKVFWHNVPESWETARRDVEVLLQEMKALAGGRLTVRWVDLEGEDGKKEVEDAGIPPMEFQVRGGDRAENTLGYSALTIEVGDESEIVNGLARGRDHFEYDVISRLYKMVRTDNLVVGLVAREPPMNPFAMGGQPQGRFTEFRKALETHLGDGLRGQLTLDDPVPPDVDVLVVASPKDMEEKAVYNAEQFVLGGGRLVLMVDPVDVEVALGRGQPNASSSGFEDWLAHLGVTVEAGVIGDYASPGSWPRRFRTAAGMMQIPVAYPYWPVLREAYIDDEGHAALHGFDRKVTLYWPAGISIDTAAQEAAGRTATVLVTTSEAGYRRQDLIGLDHAEEDEKGLTEADLEPKIPLMLLLEGPMESLWKGRPVPGTEEEPSELPGIPIDDEGAGGMDAPETPDAPDLPETPDTPDTPETPDAPDTPETPDAPEVPEAPDEPEVPDAPDGAEGPEGAEAAEGDAAPDRVDVGSGVLVLVTDADFVSDPLVGLGKGGHEFMQNVIDWMGGSDELLAVRASTAKPREFDEVDADDASLVKWLNVLGIPLLVLLAGVVVFLVRRF